MPTLCIRDQVEPREQEGLPRRVSKIPGAKSGAPDGKQKDDVEIDIEQPVFIYLFIYFFFFGCAHHEC